MGIDLALPPSCLSPSRNTNGMGEWPGKPDKMARGGGVGVVNEQFFHLHMVVCNIFFLVPFLPLKMTMENPLYESSTK